MKAFYTLGIAGVLCHMSVCGYASQGIDLTHLTSPVEVDYEVLERTEIVSPTDHSEPVEIVESETSIEVVKASDGDPIEPFNRVIFEFNDILDGLFLTPFSKIYQGVFPEEIRVHVDYVLRNLREPVNFANNLLSGEFEEAGLTLGRFATNSTLGIVGIFDVGTDWGMPYEYRDFGITMASWGVGQGGYLVLPIFGPSTFRDGPGRVVDVALDPTTWIVPHKHAYLGYSKTTATGLSDRAELQSLLAELRENSIDYYATIRSWYLEHRRFLIQEAVDAQESLESPVPFDEED